MYIHIYITLLEIHSLKYTYIHTYEMTKTYGIKVAAQGPAKWFVLASLLSYCYVTHYNVCVIFHYYTFFICNSTVIFISTVVLMSGNSIYNSLDESGVVVVVVALVVVA